jgi:hypothetical protein
MHYSQLGEWLGVWLGALVVTSTSTTYHLHFKLEVSQISFLELSVT